MKTTQILDAFPTDFDFYHLGRVEEQAELMLSLQDCSAIAFQLRGDATAWVVVIFSKELDSSVYSELGNILVSKMATQLNLQAGADVIISPPHFLSPPQVEKILLASQPLERKTYGHFYQNSVIPIETWILPT